MRLFFKIAIAATILIILLLSVFWFLLKNDSMPGFDQSSVGDRINYNYIDFDDTDKLNTVIEDFKLKVFLLPNANVRAINRSIINNQVTDTLVYNAAGNPKEISAEISRLTNTGYGELTFEDVMADGTIFVSKSGGEMSTIEIFVADAQLDDGSSVSEVTIVSNKNDDKQ